MDFTQMQSTSQLQLQQLLVEAASGAATARGPGEASNGVRQQMQLALFILLVAGSPSTVFHVNKVKLLLTAHTRPILSVLNCRNLHKIQESICRFMEE